MIHEKNLRVSLCVQELCRPQGSLSLSCSHSGISEWHGSLRSWSWLSFLFGFGFLVGLINSCSSEIWEDHGSRRSCLASTVFITQIWDCSVDTALINWNVCAKNSFSRIPLAQKCLDNFPPPLLLSVSRDNGLEARKTGCPLSLNLIIINSATLSHSPRGLLSQVGYHFSSDPGPRNDQRRGGNLFANIDTSVALAIHSRSLSSDLHMM